MQTGPYETIRGLYFIYLYRIKKREPVQTLLTRVAGFEPANDGIRIRCLTTWRYPIMVAEEGFEPPTLRV